MDEEEELDIDIPRHNHQLVRRGDGFDIGDYEPEPAGSQDQLIKIIQNPGQLSKMLSLNEEQVENVASIITGSGAGLASKYLSKYFGDEIAGAFGGFVGGFLAKKMKGR